MLVERPIPAEGVPRYRVWWRRVALAFFLAAIVAYLALAGAALAFVRLVQKVDHAKFTDVALPWRWNEYRIARGDQNIAAAESLAASGRRLEALLLVRAGVARAPRNRDGRLLLAQLLSEANRPDVARQVLLEGAAFHHTDPAYLGPLFAFLLQHQRDATVIAIARKYPPASSATRASDQLIALAAATASYFRGNYDAADDFLHTVPELSSSRDGRLLAAKIENDRGYRDLALLRLRELAAEFPNDIEVHAELAANLDRHSFADEVRRAALAFQIAHPALPGPRLELIRAYRRAGELDRATREADAFIRDFAADPSALLALADLAANTGDVPLARRLSDQAVTQKLPWEAHAILAVEALVVARDFHGAISAGQDLLQKNPDWTKSYQPVVNSLLAIAHFGLADTNSARLLLTNYLNQSYLRAENLLAIAQRLGDVDAADHARATLVRAIAVDPLNQAALTRLVELDLNLNRIDELPAHLLDLLAMRRPSPDIMRVAQHKLGSDLFLFSQERPAALEAVRVALEKSSRPAPQL